MNRMVPSRLVCCLAVLSSMACASSPRVAQRAAVPSGRLDTEEPSVDVSGLKAFLGVAEELMDEREPTEQSWLSLEESTGYAALLREEFPQSHFRKAFRLAFMPSRRAELDASLQSETIPYLDHYVRARELLEPIRRMVADASPLDRELLRLAVSAAEEYLPPSSRPRGSPPVAIVVFAPDGRGYEPIVVDALFVLELQGAMLQRFLAHVFSPSFEEYFGGLRTRINACSEAPGAPRP